MMKDVWPYGAKDHERAFHDPDHAPDFAIVIAALEGRESRETGLAALAHIEKYVDETTAQLALPWPPVEHTVALLKAHGCVVEVETLRKILSAENLQIVEESHE